MNCLNIGIAQQSGNLHLETSSRKKLAPIVEQRNEHLTLGLSIKDSIKYSFSIKDALALNISLVCTVGKDAYLKVEPKVMWVTPDMIKELLIKSNVQWTIT